MFLFKGTMSEVSRRLAVLAMTLLIVSSMLSGYASPVRADAAAPPAEVANKSLAAGNGELQLSWSNPADDDFSRVEIWNANQTRMVASVEAPGTAATIAGLSNGMNYTFVLRTVDTSGNKSKGLTLTGMPLSGVSDDFNAAVAGNAPAGWTISGGSAVLMEEPANSLQLFVALDKPDPEATASATRSVDTALTGAVNVEASFKAPDTAKTRLFQVKTGGGETVIGIAFEDEGSLAVSDGGQAVPSEIIRPYSAGAWYDVRLEIDTVERRYKLYMNGAYHGTYGLAQPAQADIQSVDIVLDSEDTDSFQFDDVFVERKPDPAESKWKGIIPGQDRWMKAYDIDDGFDSEAAGSAPAGWTVAAPDGTAAVVESVSEGSAQTQALKLTDSVSGAFVEASRAYPVSTELTILSWDYMETNLKKDTQFRIRSGTTIAVQLGVNEFADDKKKYLYYIEASGTRKKIAELAANTFYSIKVAVTPGGGTGEGRFTVYVNGIRQAAAADVPLKNEVDALDNIAFVTNGNAIGVTAYIDNVQVVSPNAEGWKTSLREAREAGAEWVRLTIDGWYSLEELDFVFGTAADYGFEILAHVMKGKPSNGYGTPAEEDLNEAYLREAVRYLKQAPYKVAYWDIHTEPNLEGYWSRASDSEEDYNGAASDFLTYMNRTYAAIKAEDPDAVVILNLAEEGAERFLDRIAMEHAFPFDELGLHPLGDTPIATSDRYDTLVRKIRSEWPAPSGQIPVWVDAGAAYQSDWPGGAGYSGLDGDTVEDAANRKADWTVEAVNRHLLQRSGNRPVFVQALHESGGEIGYGLLQLTDKGRYEAPGGGAAACLGSV